MGLDIVLSLGIRQGINAPLLDSEGEIVRTVKIVNFVFMQTYLAPSLLIHAWPFLVPFIQTLLQQQACNFYQLSQDQLKK
jgi:hypothetical protein